MFVEALCYRRSKACGPPRHCDPPHLHHHLCSLYVSRGAIVRCAIDTIAGESTESKEAKESNIAQKETGHSADSPSVLAGFKKLDQIKSEADLLPPGAQPGTVPTDAEQATGLERLEILGKMQGIDIFDMRPLDASRLGTMEDPITVNSAGNEQYEPKSRCMECGSVYEMKYVGPADDAHGHDDHHHDLNQYPRPKNMADFLKPEYMEV
ncbi:unnamed protein product [Alternaria alternata]